MKLEGRDAEPFIKVLAMEFAGASRKNSLPASVTGIQFKNDSGEPMNAQGFFQFLVNSHRLTHGDTIPSLPIGWHS
ncbi:MAG: hypothetical protein NTX79_07765 [Candidatus Micrarchaeota archaeon]|nr:hypothetical protein [Candidatus Micrarchaeota archaeon]